MRGRAFRRHQSELARRRARGYHGGAHRDDPRRLGQLARTPALCSCWMCGNPRRYDGTLTQQERRQPPGVDFWSEEGELRGFC